MKTTALIGKISWVTIVLAACEMTTAPVNETEISNVVARAMGGATSCNGVKGTITAIAGPTGAVGTIHGDIEGTITTTLLPDPVGNTGKFFTGNAIHLRGTQTVEVMGSTVAELIGRTLVWALDITVVDLPPIRRSSNRIRVVEGASGNLVSHGILDLNTGQTNFDYNGVICP